MPEKKPPFNRRRRALSAAVVLVVSFGLIIGLRSNRVHKDGMAGCAPAAVTTTSLPNGEAWIESSSSLPEGGTLRITNYNDGTTLTEYVNSLDQLDRDPTQGPAVVGQNVDGSRFRGYLQNDQFNRNPGDGPAMTKSSADGSGLEMYIQNDLRNRDPKVGPAVIEYGPNHAIAAEMFFQNNELTRDPKDGPAVIKYHPDGSIAQAEYWQDGIRLRPPIPAPHRPSARSPASLPHIASSK